MHIIQVIYCYYTTKAFKTTICLALVQYSHHLIVLCVTLRSYNNNVIFQNITDIIMSDEASQVSFGYTDV